MICVDADKIAWEKFCFVFKANYISAFSTRIIFLNYISRNVWRCYFESLGIIFKILLAGY